MQLVHGVDVATGIVHGCRVGPVGPVTRQGEAVGADHVQVLVDHGLVCRPFRVGLVVAALAVGDPVRLFIGGDAVAVALGQRGAFVDELLHPRLDKRHLFFDGEVSRRVAQGQRAHDGIFHAPGLGVLGHVEHEVVPAGLRGKLVLRRAAVPGGDIAVARDGGQDLQGAAVLHAVAVVVDGQLVVDAAVAVQGVEARGVGDARLLDLLRRNLGDLGGVLEGVLLKALDERLPSGLGRDGLAVGQLHLHAAGRERGAFGQSERIGARTSLVARMPVLVVLGIFGIGELRGVGQPCVGDDRLVGMLDPGARGGDAMALALPDALLGVPVRGLVVVLVPADEALVAAFVIPVLVDPVGVAVGLGDQAARQVDAAGALPHPALIGAPVLLGVPQEGGVRPAAHEQIVVRAVVDDPADHAAQKRHVGAHAQGQPDVGFLAERGHTRVDEDVLVGALRDVHDASARRVVVGVLDSGAPLHVHEGLLLHFHPRCGVLVGHDGGEVARALADLLGCDGVRRVEQVFERCVRGHAVDARRAARGEHRFAAILVDDLVELGAGLVEGLGQRDALPARILFALGVRALLAVAKPVGVVEGHHGGLRLGAAVTAAVGALLVAFDAGDDAVDDRHPYAAFVLAACAAARADVLHVLARARVLSFGEGL